MTCAIRDAGHGRGASLIQSGAAAKRVIETVTDHLSGSISLIRATVNFESTAKPRAFGPGLAVSVDN